MYASASRRCSLFTALDTSRKTRARSTSRLDAWQGRIVAHESHRYNVRNQAQSQQQYYNKNTNDDDDDDDDDDRSELSKRPANRPLSGSLSFIPSSIRS